MAKKWYAVVIDDSGDYGTGSSNKRDAMRMAKREAKANPHSKVEIVVTNEDDDYCIDSITVQEATPQTPEEQNAAALRDIAFYDRVDALLNSIEYDGKHGKDWTDAPNEKLVEAVRIVRAAVEERKRAVRFIG